MKALANETETGEKYGHRHHCIGDGHQFSAVPTVCGYEEVTHVAHVPVYPFRVAERKSGVQVSPLRGRATRVCHVIFGRLSTLGNAMQD